MMVARLHRAGDLRLHREPVPEVTSGTSLIRVTAVGLCGSDLHWFTDGGIGDATIMRPLVLGHEIAGIVEEGPLAGKRVCVDPSWPCGHCEHCLAGNRNLCPSVRFAGHSRDDGGLREFMVWPDSSLHLLPDGFSDPAGAMLEPLGVALHAMDLGRPRLGETVAVVGCGPIGLCAVQLARAAGADRVIAIDPLPHRLDAARRLGADAALSPGPDLDRQVQDATNGRGAGLVIECAGNDEAVLTSVVSARPGGVIVLVGIPDEDSTTFPASVARRKGLNLKLARRMKEMYPRAIGLVERGKVDVESLVTAVYSLDQVNDAFTAASDRRGLKVVVAPARQNGEASSGSTG